MTVLLAGCSRQPLSPVTPAELPTRLQGAVIVETATGATLRPQALFEQLAGAKRVLIGERHDNPDHHAIERWLLHRADEDGLEPILLLEMLNPDQQARVEDARRRLAQGEALESVPDALGWQPGWDWTLYGGLVIDALQRDAALRSANLDRTEIEAIYRLPPSLSPGAASAEPVRQALMAQIDGAHCGLLPAEHLPAMLAVQQQRDRRMAERLASAPTPAWLMAGTFHVRRDLGVPLHLADLGAANRTRVLILAEEGESVGAAQADFVWFTPAREAIDHCLSLRERQAKKDPAEPGQKP